MFDRVALLLACLGKALLSFGAFCIVAGCVARAGASDHIVTAEDNDQNKVIAQLANKIDVLERKVKGMQKQISILHAKKADKESR